VRIIGIDVAPARGGHIYEGGDTVLELLPDRFEEYIDRVARDRDVLIAWDAPLTGCRSLTTGCRSLTRRLIEEFFDTDKFKFKGHHVNPFKAPAGISVQGYSGCQHWTVSQYMVALPRIGRYHSEVKPPFNLIVRDVDRLTSGRNIVEVHPAVAIWLWCRESRIGQDPSWLYKRGPAKRDTCEALWGILQVKFREEFPALNTLRFGKNRDFVPNDDELDAIAAWLLASCWLNQKHGVSLLGDDETGSFLLPTDEPLKQEFQRFIEQHQLEPAAKRGKCTSKAAVRDGE
jgi:predicted RNase H-like nuclease